VLAGPGSNPWQQLSMIEDDTFILQVLLGAGHAAFNQQSPLVFLILG
jgi:hypothetical protein